MQPATVPKVTEAVISKLPRLRTQQTAWPLVSSGVFRDWIVTIEAKLGSPKFLNLTLSYLDAIGEILWLEDRDTVVLEPQFLTRDIVGKVLAPPYFPRSVPKIDGCRFGLPQLTRAFGARLSRRVLEATLHLGVGVLETEAGAADPVVLLPSLLERSAPLTAWKLPERGEFVVQGRRLLCNEPSDAFSTGFFPRLQVNVCRALAPVKPELWKHGLCFANLQGARVVVQQSFEGHAIDVWVWAQAALPCIQAVVSIIAMVERVRRDSCPGVPVRELALSVAELRAWRPQPDGGVPPGTVAGYAVDQLQQCSDPSAFVRPVHPDPTRSTVVERAGDLLLRPEDHATVLHPSVCPPELTTVDALGVKPARRRLRVLVVRANSLHQRVRVTNPEAFQQATAKDVRNGQVPGLVTESLDTDHEERLLKEALAQSAAGPCRVELETIGDVTCDYFRDTVLTLKPDWIHYIGHCNEAGLVLKDGHLSPVVLATLLAACPLIGLLLNCCYGRLVMAEAVQPFVDSLIAGDEQQPDVWAPHFALRFWQNVFNGCSLHDSFRDADPVSPSYPANADDADGAVIELQFEHVLTTTRTELEA
eukprot:m.472465 g.472465  ORF g.472465 m.472465 type:complete len:590 (+) comp20384_c0_seq13:1588-3357(+)